MGRTQLSSWSTSQSKLRDKLGLLINWDIMINWDFVLCSFARQGRCIFSLVHILGVH